MDRNCVPASLFFCHSTPHPQRHEGIRLWLSSAVIAPIFEDRPGDQFQKIDLGGRSLALVSLSFWGKEIQSRDPAVAIFILRVAPPARLMEEALKRDAAQVAIIGTKGAVMDACQTVSLPHLRTARFPLYRDQDETLEVFVCAPAFQQKVFSQFTQGVRVRGGGGRLYHTPYTVFQVPKYWSTRGPDIPGVVVCSLLSLLCEQHDKNKWAYLWGFSPPAFAAAVTATPPDGFSSRPQQRPRTLSVPHWSWGRVPPKTTN